MPYVSAKYTSPEADLYLNPLLVGAPPPPRQVQAVDNTGLVWSLTDDSEVGDWLEYVNGGGVIDPYVAPPISTYEVNAERDRRITGGFDFMGHRFQSDEFSQRNIMDAMQAADTAIAEGADDDDYSWQQYAAPAPQAVDPRAPPGSGSTGPDYYWITADNFHLPMTAYDVRNMAQYMLRMKQRMIRNGRALKDLDPIPMDYTDDKYWPFDPPPPIPL